MNPIPRTIYRRAAVPTLRVLIGAVFVYAGQAKVRVPMIFADDIASFRLLPWALNNLLAIGLPPFEILLGLLLVAGWGRRLTGFSALVTSGIFLVALLSAWMRGIPVECGCFGADPGTDAHGPPLWMLIGRDLLLLAGSAVVYADAHHRKITLSE